MKTIGKFKISKATKNDDEVCYLMLPGFPKKPPNGFIKSQIRLAENIEKYKGPDIYLDYDDKGYLVGIEILL
ncbi:MAG: DUF2283 domain-containing protein [Proteobacteria bacterium]|nr:DUF2283 domain-containing protein [Pseudomonadota bacterium]